MNPMTDKILVCEIWGSQSSVDLVWHATSTNKFHYINHKSLTAWPSFLFDTLNLPSILFQIKHIKVIPTPPFFFYFLCNITFFNTFWYRHFLHHCSYYQPGMQYTCLQQEIQPLPCAHKSWESKGGESDVYSFWIFQSTKYLICDKSLRKTCTIVKLRRTLLWHSIWL